MTRKQIETALADGARLIIQDKVDGSVYCSLMVQGSPADRKRYKRIRFDQYIHQFDAKDHLRLAEKTSVKGYDHCEYIAGPALTPAPAGE